MKYPCSIPEKVITDKIFRNFDNAFEIQFDRSSLTLLVFIDERKSKICHDVSTRNWALFSMNLQVIVSICFLEFKFE